MSEQFKKYRLHAFLRTLSPLHITSPESARLDVANMKVVYGDSMGIPLNQVQKLNVKETGEKVRSIPVIAANNIAGRLRRHTAAKVLDVLKAKGQRVSITTYSAMQCGAATGKPDGRDPQFTEFRETREHPYIGLMGGGPRMAHRYVSVMNALPYMDGTAFMLGTAKHPHLDDAVHKFGQDARQLTQFWILNRNDDLRELVNVAQAQDTILNFEEEINKRQQAILADSKSNSNGEGSSRHSTRSFSSFEFVVPGVYFPMRFDLTVNDAQLGLFLMALDSFADTERLGGQARNGMGQFSLSDVVLTDPQNNILADNLFVNNRLRHDVPFVQDALKAWGAAAELLNAQDLDRLFAPPTEDAKPKKVKKVEEAA